jgi:hypothetical protein
MGWDRFGGLVLILVECSFLLLERVWLGCDASVSCW